MRRQRGAEEPTAWGPVGWALGLTWFPSRPAFPGFSVPDRKPVAPADGLQAAPVRPYSGRNPPGGPASSGNLCAPPQPCIGPRVITRYHCLLMEIPTVHRLLLKNLKSNCCLSALTLTTPPNPRPVFNLLMKKLLPGVECGRLRLLRMSPAPGPPGLVG